MLLFALQLELLLRKVENERIKAFGGSEEGAKDTYGSLHKKKLHFLGQKSATEASLSENEVALSTLENQLLTEMGDKNWLVKTYITNKNVMIENCEHSINNKHLTDCVKVIIKRLESNEKLVIELADQLRQFYQIMSGMNRLSSDLEDAFNGLLKKVAGKKSVVWRDDQGEPALSNVSRYDLENMFMLGVNHAIPGTPRPSRKSRQLTSILCTPDQTMVIDTKCLGNTCTKSKSSVPLRPVHLQNINFDNED